LDARRGFFGVRPSAQQDYCGANGLIATEFWSADLKIESVDERGTGAARKGLAHNNDMAQKAKRSRLLFGRRQVEIHVAFAIEPGRQTAIYRAEWRLPLFVFQRDEVQRAISYPVRFSRTNVVLILKCNQVNRPFVAVC
jgi:hypothetical protein